MTYRQIHPQFNDTFVHFPGVPDLTRETLWNYLGYGLPPGGFVTAVLKNNFILAATRTDHTWSGNSLKDLAKWIIQYMPYDSYGSKDCIEKWMQKTDQERMEIMIELKPRPGEFDILRGPAVP